MAPTSRAEPYLKFLKQFEAKMFNPRARRASRKLPLDQTLPGLFPLLQSFSSLSVEGSGGLQPVTEWNPLSQRPYFPASTQLGQGSRKNLDLKAAAEAVRRFIETAHEATHVLLWEPFFCGRPFGHATPKITAASFQNMSLCFEGYCFWYADILVTRDLRVRLPDGEFAFSRSAVSEPLFHPYRAFQAMGMGEDLKILDVYLDGFVGNQSALSRNQKKLFAGAMYKRITLFYVNSLQPLKRFKEQLDATKIFTDFRNRFCNVTGLPSLLPPHLLNLDFTKDPAAFCRAVFLEGMPAIAKLSDSDLNLVRIRRAIQTRAYSAYALQAALLLKRIYSVKVIPQRNLLRLEVALSTYLDQLEIALGILAQGGSPTRASKAYQAADRFYNVNVRKILKLNEVWVSKRLSVLPHVDAPIGLLNAEQSLKPVVLRTLHKFAIELAAQILTRNSKMNNRKVSADNHLQLKLATILARASALHRRNSKANFRLYVQAFNQLMVDRSMLDVWSVQLAAIDPNRNQFRELFFRYV